MWIGPRWAEAERRAGGKKNGKKLQKRRLSRPSWPGCAGLVGPVRWNSCLCPAGPARLCPLGGVLSTRWCIASPRWALRVGSCPVARFCSARVRAPTWGGDPVAAFVVFSRPLPLAPVGQRLRRAPRQGGPDGPDRTLGAGVRIEGSAAPWKKKGPKRGPTRDPRGPGPAVKRRAPSRAGLGVHEPRNRR